MWPRGWRGVSAAGATIGIALPQCAGAHATDGVPTLATAWSFSPQWMTLPVLILLLHVLGLARLWRRAGFGRGVSVRQATYFAAGVALLALALIWPLDAYGEWSLAAHMSQHMLLIAFAPPLLLAGRARAMLVHALPRAWLAPLHQGAAAPQSHLVAALATATLVHALVLCAWHLPGTVEIALANESVHVAMHASFLIAGLWWWSALRRCIREPHAGVWPGLVALVSTMMLMGMLGALLTFSRRSLYAVYELRAPQLGLDVLSDQQLAGLIMWVPACLPYLLGAAWLVQRGLLSRRGTAFD